MITIAFRIATSWPCVRWIGSWRIMDSKSSLSCKNFSPSAIWCVFC